MKLATPNRLPKTFTTARLVPSLKSRAGIWTDAELLALGESSIKYELWDGKIIAMPPAKPLHGIIITRLTCQLGVHVGAKNLGHLLDGQTGFRLSIEHCFEPDIAYVSHRRMKTILPHGDLNGIFHGAPDLAVEVLSPSDSITKTERKLQLYLAHGSYLAWMVDPKHKSVRVYRKPGEFELLRGDLVDCNVEALFIRHRRQLVSIEF